MHIFKKKNKLAITADKKQVRGVKPHDEVDDLLEDIFGSSSLYDNLEAAELNVWHAAQVFSRTLNELNNINAQLGRGPVDLEDVLFHHCVAQETLNQRYANANALYTAHCNAQLAKLDPTDTNDQDLSGPELTR